MIPQKGETYSNIWGRDKESGQRVPNEASFVCCHRLFVQAILDVDEYLYLRVTTSHNELWCISELEPESDLMADPEQIHERMCTA